MNWQDGLRKNYFTVKCNRCQGLLVKDVMTDLTLYCDTNIVRCLICGCVYFPTLGTAVIGQKSARKAQPRKKTFQTGIFTLEHGP